MDAAVRHPDLPKLRLFKTPNGKSPYWYAGFHKGGAFLRRSMKTTDLNEAQSAAARWYEDTAYELRKGTYVAPRAVAGPKVSTLVERTLAAMIARGRSAAYARTCRAHLITTGYVGRYFGPLGIKDVDSRTWDDFRIWLSETRAAEKKPQHSERTVHQMKNALNLLLGQAYVDRKIDAVPRFEDRMKPKNKDGRPRVYFDQQEYAALLKFARRNIREHDASKTRWRQDARELKDYIVFMVNTGLRVDESKALRFRDVRIVEAPVLIKGTTKIREVCQITVTKGKRGAAHPCVSYLSAPAVVRRIIARRGIENPTTSSEPLFLSHHRDAFKRLLRQHDLYIDAYGRKRDFVSLRHSYICYRLMAGVPPFMVAKNVRTSVDMIERHYAKALGATSLAVNVTN